MQAIAYPGIRTQDLAIPAIADFEAPLESTGPEALESHVTFYTLVGNKLIALHKALYYPQKAFEILVRHELPKFCEVKQ